MIAPGTEQAPHGPGRMVVVHVRPGTWLHWLCAHSTQAGLLYQKQSEFKQRYPELFFQVVVSGLGPILFIPGPPLRTPRLTGSGPILPLILPFCFRCHATVRA